MPHHRQCLHHEKEADISFPVQGLQRMRPTTDLVAQSWFKQTQMRSRAKMTTNVSAIRLPWNKTPFSRNPSKMKKRVCPCRETIQIKESGTLLYLIQDAHQEPLWQVPLPNGKTLPRRRKPSKWAGWGRQATATNTRERLRQCYFRNQCLCAVVSATKRSMCETVHPRKCRLPQKTSSKTW